MSVDAPTLNGKPDESVALGRWLFDFSIATAICSSIDLVYYDYFLHKVHAVPSIAGGLGARGHLSGTPAPRARSGVVGWNTDHADRDGRKRHYLYGMPRTWADENGLTSAGWDGVMGYAHLLAMGLQGHFGHGQMQLLIPYWNVIELDLGNFFGVAFRRVASFNVFQHTDKAPGISEDLWPPSPT